MTFLMNLMMIGLMVLVMAFLFTFVAVITVTILSDVFGIDITRYIKNRLHCFLEKKGWFAGYLK